MSDDFVVPTAGPEHAALNPFVGKFKSEVKLWFGPDSDPVINTGTMVNSWQLNGLYLHQDYQGDASDGPFPNFEGKGYWGWNPVINKYEGFWIDTASSIMQTEIGDLDETGKIWTMLSEVPNPHGEGTLVKRSLITLIDNDHHRMETWFGSGEHQMKNMEISYVRD